MLVAASLILPMMSNRALWSISTSSQSIAYMTLKNTYWEQVSNTVVSELSVKHVRAVEVDIRTEKNCYP